MRFERHLECFEQAVPLESEKAVALPVSLEPFRMNCS
jgi:hypothetical protein